MITKNVFVYYTVDCDICGCRHYIRDDEGAEKDHLTSQDEALEAAKNDFWRTKLDDQGIEHHLCDRCAGKIIFENRVELMDKDSLIGWILEERKLLHEQDWSRSEISLRSIVKNLAAKNPHKYYKP